jgi:hypothetical protein
MAPAVDLPIDPIVRLVDQTFDPFRWRNVDGPGRINKQVRNHADGSILSVDIDTELRVRVWASRPGPVFRLIGMAVSLQVQRIRIARTLARFSASGGEYSDGNHRVNRTGRALLIGG